jgi:hypothetical protein
MAARFGNSESSWKPLLPQAAKELIFWCAVLVAVVSGGVLVAQMDAIWRFPDPPGTTTDLASASAVPTLHASDSAP